MIALRDIRPKDKELTRRWRNLPEVALYMYRDPYIFPGEHERWLSETVTDPALLDHQPGGREFRAGNSLSYQCSEPKMLLGLLCGPSGRAGQGSGHVHRIPHFDEGIRGNEIQPDLLRSPGFESGGDRDAPQVGLC